MQLDEALLAELAVHVCIVTFEGAEAAKAYVSETGIRWPILVDTEGVLYDAYGMGRLSWRQMLDPSAAPVFVAEILRGNLPRWPRADPARQGGDVLIDPTGIVRFVHVGSNPGDRPAVERLLDIRRAAARQWRQP